MVTGLHHTSRTVSDMEASLRFYRDLLGLEVVVDEDLEGEQLDLVVGLAGARLRVVELRLGRRLLLELIQYLAPRGAAPSTGRSPADVGAHHLALLVDDIHTAYRRLVDAGVRFTTEPAQIGGGLFAGTWTTYCFDPDDLAVELWQPPVTTAE